MILGMPRPVMQENSIKVEDVFAVSQYVGNAGAQTVVNGIDLATHGGLVWTKGRNNYYSHFLIDTVRGGNNSLSSDNANGNNSISWNWSPNSQGYSFNTSAAAVNQTGYSFASWTFRKAPKFFDIVTYTGNGVAGRQISHNLGIEPGMIIVKSLSSGAWVVYHRSRGNNSRGVLNEDSSFLSSAPQWNNTTPTDTVFSLGGSSSSVNDNSVQYVAYLFAHDPSADGMVQCGSYVGNGSTTGPVINLGWKAQYVLIKNASLTGSWVIVDSARGMTTGLDKWLFTQSVAGEGSTLDLLDATSTGFNINTNDTALNANANTYIYIAIRDPQIP